MHVVARTTPFSLPSLSPLPLSPCFARTNSLIFRCLRFSWAGTRAHHVVHRAASVRVERLPKTQVQTCALRVLSGARSRRRANLIVNRVPWGIPTTRAGSHLAQSVTPALFRQPRALRRVRTALWGVRSRLRVQIHATRASKGRTRAKTAPFLARNASQGR
jgi:hypothetical protein